MAPVLLLVAILRALQVKRLAEFSAVLSPAHANDHAGRPDERSRKQRKRGMLPWAGASSGHSATPKWPTRFSIATSMSCRICQFARTCWSWKTSPRASAQSSTRSQAALAQHPAQNTKPVMDSDIGAPWIHGIGIEEEQEIGIPFTSLPGHTLITGTTRAGKTCLYEMITAQIVDMGSFDRDGPEERH